MRLTDNGVMYGNFYFFFYLKIIYFIYSVCVHHICIFLENNFKLSVCEYIVSKYRYSSIKADKM